MFRLLLLGALVYFSIKIFRRFLLIQAGQKSTSSFNSAFYRKTSSQKGAANQLDHIEDADFTEIKDDSKSSNS